MKNVIAFTALAASLISGAAIAASTTELKVTGVIKPPACAATIAGGGTVDYGTIPVTSLNKTSPTKLATKEVPFSFSCDASTKIALKFTDNKASTKVTGLGGPVGAIFETTMMGLGAASGKNIGAYQVTLKQGSFTADGAVVDTLNSPDQGASWYKGDLGTFYTDRWLSWGKTGTTTPVSVKTVSGTLSVTAVIDKTDNLVLISDVPLDGSGTIEVVYL
ncbi:DUF1120 domain-containing protein [Herbaspirillum sp. LeCh32-8]|uniref:DUF1120 domain-containing protein n=1 Tax=Herbaspirillum sp. LeCh32-8 TaxID=2821356 RepID=UPI001AE672C8|nr:DUF1120 domain-containing protein [Herbaspirillum sp. LeCh32-8]MBP0598934.1 DUF1120 domain-containing protein [Herbaspirillum sp. LeCh32-8]